MTFVMTDMRWVMCTYYMLCMLLDNEIGTHLTAGTQYNSAQCMLSLAFSTTVMLFKLFGQLYCQIDCIINFPV